MRYLLSVGGGGWCVWFERIGYESFIVLYIIVY
jgi:hypothetical protein